MQIPQSTWVLKKEYFNAKLVDNFKEHYLRYMKNECGHDCDDSGLLNFIDSLTCLDYVILYQFPNENKAMTYDYFEKIDDNHVIPRALFHFIAG